MGRKRIPLRKLYSSSKVQQEQQSSNEGGRKRTSVEKESSEHVIKSRKTNESSAISSNSSSSCGKKTVASSSSNQSQQKVNKTQKNIQEDEVDWEEIEQKQQQHFDEINSDEEVEEESDEDSDADGIQLEGNLDHVEETFTFEFNDMKDLYTEGICTLLRRMIANPTDAFNLAKLITSQTVVGTVVNNEGDSDTFAFATVIPMNRHQSISSLSMILEYLDDCVEQQLLNKDKPTREQYQLLRDCLSGQYYPNTGLLIHKRFTNLPLQLMTALHRNLEEDISWAKQQASEDAESLSDADDSNKGNMNRTSSAMNRNSSSNDSRKVVDEDNIPTTRRQRSLSTSSTDSSRQQQFFGNAYYTILLSECTVSNADQNSSTGQVLKEKHGSVSILNDTNAVIFDCFEDEVYLQHAVAATLFRPPKQCCESDLVAMVIPVSKIKSCANDICSFVPE